MTKPRTTKETVEAIYTILLGEPGTGAGGAIGKLNKIEEHMAQINGAVRTNTIWRKVAAWAIATIFTALIMLIAYLSNHNVGG